MAEHTTKGSDHAGFYVGYLPTPRSHRLFLSVMIPVLGVLILGGSALLASRQRDPGATIVVTGTMESWTGTAFMDPYPMLVTDSGESHLVMGLGKFSVADRVEPFDGRRCVIDGWRLQRGDRRGIQLALEPDAIRAIDGAAMPQPSRSSGQPIEIIGEIVDGKCHIGAMKPGDGKAHKSCAILCISGGLPPLFSPLDSDGFDSLPLVLIDGSSALPDSIIKLAGEPVVIRGVLSRQGTLEVIETSADQIERWTP